MKYNVSSYLNIDKSFYYKSGVYKIYHIINPTIVYIGSTKTLSKYSGFYSRLTVHIRDLITNRHHSKYLQNVINKYGIEGIRFEIIECIDNTQKVIRDKEKYWIEYYIACNSKYGYNTIFDIQIIESRKSKNSKRILQYSLNGDFIKLWNSIEEASRFYNTKGSNISKAAKSQGLQVGNFQWRYFKENYPLEIEKYQMRNTTKIYMYENNGDFIQEFTNCNQASLKLKIQSGEIHACLNGKQITARGYRFSYKKLEKIPILSRFTKLKKKVVVLDTLKNKIIIFNSVKEMQKEIGNHSKTYKKIKKNGKLYKNRYEFI